MRAGPENKVDLSRDRKFNSNLVCFFFQDSFFCLDNYYVKRWTSSLFSGVGRNQSALLAHLADVYTEGAGSQI